MLMVALVALAAFATTMSLKMSKRAVSELTVISEATTWDFSSDVTLSSDYSGDLKYTGDDKNTEHIYANIEELSFAETFKSDALAFKGEYPFRSNSKKFAQNGTLHFKTSVAGKIVVKFSDTGSSASATAVKRYLVVNGEQTTYWASRENNGDEPYAAQLNVTTDEIAVPAGDVTIAGSSAIIVSYVAFTPDAADPEPTPASKEVTMQYTGTTTTNMTGNNDAALVGLNADEWSVVGAKGASNYFPGLNKDGTIRLYWNASGSNTITVSSLKNATINSITLDLKSSNNNISVTVNGNPVEGTDGTYAINSTSFVLGNANTSNAQVHINSVKITYTEGGAEPEPVGPQDIVIAPASGDIYAALAEATAGKEVKSITINLTKDAAYTASAALVTPADFTINGNGATIDASGNEGDFLTLDGTTALAKKSDGTDSDHKLIAAVEISGVKIAGLKGAVVTDAQKTLVEKLTISDAVIEMPAAGKNVLNFNGKGYVGEVVVKNSTIWANGNNTGFFAQYGSRPKNVNGDWLQQFDVQNSTFVNIAYGKNFCNFGQKGTAQNVYTVKNNIFVNCGKSAGQVVIGFNSGQTSASPIWAVDNNAFNFDDADTGAAEVTKAGKKDDVDIVQNSVAGIMTFTDAANGDFSGEFGIAGGASIPEVKPGDPHWAVEFKYVYKDVETLAALNALENADKFYYTGVAQIVAQGKAGESVYTYIKDESASSLIFDADGTKSAAAVVGRNIAANWTGDVAIVNGMFQLLPTEALTLAEGEAQEVEYPVVDFSYITAEHANEVVMLSGVTYQLVNNEDITITTMDGSASITAFNKFALAPGFATKDVEYNIVGAITVNGEAVEFWPVAFVEKPTVDITVYPKDGTDISAAIDEASKGHFVRNITINLAAVDGGSAKYTITKPIEAAGSLTINGNSAIIDASALEAPFVTTPDDNPAEWIKELAFFMSDVTVTGLSQALFYSAGKNRAYETFMVNNSVIEVAGDVTVFDFTKGSVAVNFMMAQSTIYAPTATTKSLYSSQGGQKATELSSETVQKFNLAGNTLYNLATGKNFFSHRQSNQKWLTYFVNNNIFVNCGKNGQTIKGLNGGQGGKNPTWGVSNNAFNFVTYNEDGTFLSEDTGAKEDNGDSEEPITNTYAGSVYFKDAANANFAIDAASAAAVAGNVGDTRWGTYEVAHYNIMVSEEALQYADIAVQATAIEDEIVKVTVTEKNGFKLKELIAKVGTQTTLKVTDNSFIMPPANVGVDAIFDVIAADYELAPAAGTDIAEALDGLIIRNLKLTLAEGGAYTLTKPIEFSGNLELTGNGATVDASALEAAFVNLAAEPAIDPIVEKKTDEATGETTETILSYPIDNISINGVTIKGLAYQLVKSNNLYLVKELVLDNSVVERLGVQKKSLFDFSGGTGGNVINLTVNKSTLYSDATTQHQNGDFFTSQSSKSIDQMGVDVTAEGFKATTTITNSTFYGIASGKTVSSLRKNSQAYMLYVVKNNVIVNSGKSGQFVKGLNAGSDGAAENYDADTNLFNFNNDVVEETAAKSAENVKNSVNAIVTFKDVEAGDFNMSIFKDPRVAELPAIGDPRWAVTGVTTGYAINIDEAIENGTVTASKSWSAADETIKLTVTPAEGYELESITVKMGAAEIILEEDNSFIMPAADVTVSATFIAVPKLYIIGGPKDWNLADMTELTYNLETQTYEFEYKPETTAYFAIADKQFTAEEAAAENAWDVFNANNRYALGEGDMEIDLEVTKPLVKANGTLVLYAGTYKISITKDMQMTVTGERAPEPTVEKLYIMGTGTPQGWSGTTELTFNEATQAFEYVAEVTEDTYLTFGDAEWTSWDDFNGKHRFAPAEGNTEATLDQAVQLVLVNDGNVLLKTPGTYKLSVTKDLVLTVTAEATGINAIAVDKLDNAVIYNLQGVRIDKSQAKGGVFIVNGKKTAIK